MNDLVESFSGIRGIYGKSLNEELAKKYASAFLFWLKDSKAVDRPKLVVGRDTRESSETLANLFIESFVNAGCEVIDCGVSSTPATENAVRYFKCDAGVMISGSHNTPEYNGWKLLRGDGAILSAEDAEKVIGNVNNDKVQGSRFKVQGEEGKVGDGEVIKKSSENIRAYTDFVAEIIGEEGIKMIKDRKFKVLFDHGGGASIPFVKPLVQLLGIDAIHINDKPGEFNRVIEPTVESLKYLIPKLKESGADFAVGLDCDADRAEFVTTSGEMVSGQLGLAIVVDELLGSHSDPKSQTIVVNDATSDLVHEIAKKHEASVHEVEVGEINVVNSMKDLQSIAGGEGSSGGSIISPQTCRDGLLACSIIVRHLAKTGKSLQEILNSFTRFYTLNEKVKISPNPEFRKNLENHFSEHPELVITKTGDQTGGIKIRFEDSAWLWCRGSKTEPGMVRIYTESKDKERANEILQKGVKLAQSLPFK